MNTKDKIFSCTICNKKYSSKNSLYNHKNLYHKNDSIINNKPDNNIIKCEHCNTIFTKTYNLTRHKNKYCKKIDKKEDNKEDLLKEQNKFLLNQIERLTKLLSTKNNNINNSHNTATSNSHNTATSNSHNTTNNKTINNTYVSIGNMAYEKILTNNEVKNILGKQFMSLEESINTVHFNDKYPEYNNIFITNMKDDLAYIFNGKEFITMKKNEILSDLIDLHLYEINLSLDKHKKSLPAKVVLRLEAFLDKINDDDTKFKDCENDKVYPSYKAYKIDSIKLIIYNKSNKLKLKQLKSMDLIEKKYQSNSN